MKSTPLSPSPPSPSVLDQTTGHSNGSTELIQGLKRVLTDISHFIQDCTLLHYTAHCGPMFSHATIGAHVRHCTDHIAAFTACFEVPSTDRDKGEVIDRCIDYEARKRGTPIETDPSVAITVLSRLIEALDSLKFSDSNPAVWITVLPHASAQTQLIESSVSRELAYLLSHTIHHQATMRSMATHLGLEVSPSFGQAPSTLLHARQNQVSASDTAISITPSKPKASSCAH